MVKKYLVSLTEAGQNELQDITRRRNAKAPAVKRAYVLLAADENGENLPDSEMARRYKVTTRCIEGLRKRFVENGFSEAVYGKKRTVSKEKTFDGRVEAHLVALRCSDPPQGHSAWTLHLLAEQMVRLGYVESISHESVRQLLKKNQLKPWRQKEWVIPTASAEFVCAMEEVLDVYEQSYDESHPVVCLDESPHQLISETRAGFVDGKGVEHVDDEYRREGVVDIYMIAEPKAGKRYVQIRDSHDSHQWAGVVAYIAEKLYPNADGITLVQDNLTAHRKAALYEVFEAERARSMLRRIHFVQTPKHGSWLNMAEIELSVLNRVALKKE